MHSRILNSKFLLAVVLFFIVPAFIEATFNIDWYQSSSLNNQDDTTIFNTYKGRTTTTAINFADTTSGITYPSSTYKPTTYFAWKITGRFTVSSGTYTFTVTADDGVLVKVGGKTVIDGWVPQAPTTYTGSVTVSSGTVDLEIWYFQSGGGGTLVVQYSGPGTSGKTVDFTSGQVTAIEPPPFYVSYLGTRYAALDGVSPNSKISTCQTTSISIPSGWSVAPNNAVSQMVAVSFPWGLPTCLTVTGGTGISSTVFKGSCLNITLATSGAISLGKGCRLLITQPAVLDDDDSLPVISQGVVLAGTEFSTLDGANPTDQPSGYCSNAFRQIPSGWSFASSASSPQLPLILTGTYRFGAINVATSDGNAFDVTSGKGLTMSGGSYQSATVTVGSNSYTLYRAVSPPSGCSKILVSKSTTDGNTWNTHPTISAYVVVTSGTTKTLYATLDNDLPTDQSSSCQTTPVVVPSGWSLASKNTNLITLLNSKGLSYGTDCLIFGADSSTFPAPGKTVDCSGSNVATISYKSETYYYVKNCTLNKKILIQTAQSSLDPAAPCGTCYAWGDPHVQILNGVSFDFFLQGSYIYLKPVASEPQNYLVYTEQYPVQTATANIAIYIVYKSASIKISVDPFGKQGLSWFSYNGNNYTTLSQVPTGSNGLVSVSRTPSTGNVNEYDIKTDNNLQFKIIVSFWNINMLDLYITVPNSLIGLTTGICGACGSASVPYGNDTNSNFNCNGNFNCDQTFGNSWANVPTPAPTTAKPTTAAPTTAAPTTAKPTTAGPTTAAPTTACTKPTVSLPPATEDATGSTCPSAQTPYFKADNGDPYQVTLPAGYRFDYAYVKAGTSCIRSNINDNTLCYKTWVNGSTLTTARVGTPSPNCQTISHVFFYATDCGTASTTVAPTTAAPTTAAPTTAAPTTAAPTSATTAAPTPKFVPSQNVTCDQSLLSQAQRICKNLLTDPVKINFCITDICATGSTGCGHSTANQNSNDNSGKVVTGNNTCVDVPITNTVTVSGHLFATLDNANPLATSLKTTANTINLPDGWTTAPDCGRVKATLSCYNWGAGCVVLSPGYGYTSGLSQCGGGVASYGNVDCITPLPDNSRLLITKSVNITDDDCSVDKWSYSKTPNLVSNSRRAFTKAVSCTGTNTNVATLKLPQTVSHSFSWGLWGQAVSYKGGSTTGFNCKIEALSGNTVVETRTIQFDTSSTDWHYRVADFSNPNNVACDSVRVTYSTPDNGEYHFGDHDVDSGSPWGGGNFLSNPTFDNDANGWSQFNGGFSFTKSYSNDQLSSKAANSGCVKVTNTDNTKDAGAIQLFPVDSTTASKTKSIYFRGDSLTTGLTGNYSNGYSIYCDVIYTDGTSTWGIVAPFNPTVTGWQSSDRTFKIPDGKTIKSIQVAGLIRGLVGTAYFDNIYITLLDCDARQTDTQPTSYGDPHINTLDNHYYDLYTVGDFLLYQDFSLSIITRQCIQGFATVNCVALINYNGTLIEIERSRNSNPPYFYINGVQKSIINDVSTNINDVAYLIVTGSLAPGDKNTMSYQFSFPSTNHKLVITAHLGDFGDQWIQYYPSPPTSAINGTKGLLGNFNGDPNDDYEDALGNIYPIDSNETVIYDLFAESWRIPNAPFVISNQQNAATSTTRLQTKQINDFPQAARDQAYSVCKGVGLLDLCVLDYLLSNGDAGYATGYSSLESLIISPNITANAASSSSSSGISTTQIAIICGVIGGAILIAIVIGIILFIKRDSFNKI